MNDNNLHLAENLIPRTYVLLAQQARAQQESLVTNLLAQKRLPDEGWDEGTIERLLQDLASMDSNNARMNVGVGEREGRIASGIVARRHFRFAHGIGRSGELTEVQPKAAGASLIGKLTNHLVLDAMRVAELRVENAIVVPMATGMALALSFLTLSQLPIESGPDPIDNPDREIHKSIENPDREVEKPIASSDVVSLSSETVVLWPRIDQKSCFKSISTANCRPIPIPMKLEGDELRTDLEALEKEICNQMARSPRPRILVMTTTSCFAPRAPDKIIEVARLCMKFRVCHVVNNAYGLQDKKVCRQISAAFKEGRIDAVVQSTDKNFMVPVGGAIIAGKSDFIGKISKNYPGRASSAPVLDLFITLLHLGRDGYKRYLQEREDQYVYLRRQMTSLAIEFGERVLETPNNPISIGMTLRSKDLFGDSPSSSDVTALGSMLFARNVSGVRVITGRETKTVSGIAFTGFGSHADSYPMAPYLTAAAAIGMTKAEVDTFITRLRKTLTEVQKKRSRKNIIIKESIEFLQPKEGLHRVGEVVRREAEETSPPHDSESALDTI